MSESHKLWAKIVIMKEYNKLVRDNVAGLLKNQGFELKGRKLQGEELDFQLFSLFWQNFKTTFEGTIKEVKVAYAEMLEVIRTFMIKNEVNPSQLQSTESQPVKWYKNTLPAKEKLNNARANLLERFDELMGIKTQEARQDQLGDVLDGTKQVIGANGYEFAEIEEIRRESFKRFGGYTKGVYIEGVSKKREYSI